MFVIALVGLSQRSDWILQALKEMEKAIISSPLGLNPTADSQRLVVPIPP